MSYSNGPSFLRNLKKHLPFAILGQDATELPAIQDKRGFPPKPTPAELPNLSIDNSRDLTSFQTPLLRINLTKLVRHIKENEEKEIGVHTENMGSPKKRLISQCRCQIQLAIRHQQEDAPNTNFILLYSDQRNSMVKFSQGSGMISSVIELDSLFEIEMSKLLVVNPKDKNWKYKMASRYHLNVTLRFLQCEDLEEFLPNIFGNESRPSAQIHAVFGASCSTTLISGQTLCPFIYQSHSLKRDTGHQLLVDSQWFGTSKTCLQLLQTRSPRPQTPRRPDEIRFAVSVKGNPKVFPVSNFECIFCNRKDQGSLDALDHHLKTSHTQIAFVRKDVADNGKVAIQFTVTETRPKSSKESHLATPPESVDTPPHDTVSGESSWLEDKKWVVTREPAEQPSQGHTRNDARNNAHNVSSPNQTLESTHKSPETLAPKSGTHRPTTLSEARQPVPGISTEGTPRNRKANPYNPGPSMEIRTVNGKKTLHSTGSTSPSEKGRLFTQYREHHQGSTTASLPHVNGHMTVGRAAVADMTRTEDLKRGSGNTRDFHPRSQLGDSINSSSRLVQRDGVNPVIPATSNLSAEDIARRRSHHNTLPMVRPSTPTTIASPGMAANQGTVRAKSSAMDGGLLRMSDTDRLSNRKAYPQQVNPSSDQPPQANQSAHFLSSALHSSTPPLQQRHTVGFSPKARTHDHNASGENRGPHRADDQVAQSPRNMLPMSNSHKLPMQPRLVPSPVQGIQQSRDQMVISAFGPSVRAKHGVNDNMSPLIHVARSAPEALIYKESEASLQTALGLSRELPESNRRKYVVPAAPKGVTLFRTSTKRALVEGEYASESEDDIDESWAQRRHQETIDSDSDTTLAEKTFMKRWDDHFAKEQLNGNTYAAKALLRFAAANRDWLSGEDMRREFSRKIGTWYGDNVISWGDMSRCMSILRHPGNPNARKVIEDVGDRGAVPPVQNSTKRQSSWLSACSCGIPVSVTDMHRAVSCAGDTCTRPDYHLACAGLTARPDSWYCSECSKSKG